MERDKTRNIDDDRKESISICLDDGDGSGESITLTVAGLTKGEKRYILDMVHDLQIIDRDLDNAQARGDEDAVQALAQEYDQRRRGVANYLQAKGIPYRMAKSREVHRVLDKEQCHTCQREEESQRRYIRRRKQQEHGMERDRQRKKND